jgi:xanthine/CO dehydrogenase XdhC/CoxF family maturation factor
LDRTLNGLKDTGVFISDDFVRAVHGAAGLDLGAKTPEEIALSIMAEILPKRSVIGRPRPPLLYRQCVQNAKIDCRVLLEE